MLYGTAYALSSDIAKIHTITMLFVAIGCVRGNLAIIEHKLGFGTAISVVSSVLNVAANYYMILRYGIYGVAYAILIAQIVSGYVSSIFNKDYWRYWKLQTEAILLLPLWHILSNNWRNSDE